MKRFTPFVLAAVTLAVLACQEITGPDAEAPLLSKGPGQVVLNQHVVLFDRGLPDADAAAQGIAQAQPENARYGG